MQKKKAIQIIAGVVLLSCIILNITITSNLHYHILDNGRMIVHGHPYDRSEDKHFPKHHSHSALEFLLYFFLTNIEILALLLFILTSATELTRYISCFFQHFIFKNPFFVLPVLRAPPLYS